MLTGGEAQPAQTQAQTPEPAAKSAQSSSTPAQTQSSSGDRVKASPYAKATAKEKGVDLTQVVGTGPGGRIINADVLEYQPPKQTEQAKEKAAQVKKKKQNKLTLLACHRHTNNKICFRRLHRSYIN